MKLNRRFERSMPEDRGELRVLLREWKAPEPPPEMEEALLLRVRRRPAWKRGAAWLVAAACVALVFVDRRATPPPGADSSSPQPRSAASQPPAQSSARSVVPSIIPPITPRGERPAPRHDGSPLPGRRVKRSEPAVLVEPGQAALYAELARQLRGMRQAPPGVSPPPIEVISVHARPPLDPYPQGDLLPDRSSWEVVGSEWPFVRRAL